jgi:putative ABC transport system permease protein
LTESVVLAAAGGLAGLAIAQWSLDAFVALAPAGIPRLSQVAVDSAVLVFTSVISLASGLLFGLFPAVQTKLVDLNSTLKEGGRGTAVAGSSNFRRALVVVEIALSLVLLTGAGITIRSFVRLRQVETGFDARNVLAVRMGVNPAKYAGEKTVALYDEVQRRLAILPGVQVTGLTNSIPPIQNDLNDSFTVEGRFVAAGNEAPTAIVLLVDPGYFKALNIPILHGRAFLDTDRANGPRVALINETLANRHFPNADPIGKRIKIGGADRPDTPWMEIVGIAKDVRYDGLKGPIDPAYYMPFAQVPQRGQDIVIKTAGDPASLINAVRSEIRAVDADIPLLRVITLEQRMSEAVGEPRFQTTLLAVFSGIALLLSAIGIYAVISYSITLRTHEIGVRMSLGASRSDVLRMVVREGMMLAIVGALTGLVGALALTRFMAGVLFEISPRDPLTFAAVSGIMLGVAFLACFIPARRATRVDPMIALRYE